VSDLITRLELAACHAVYGPDVTEAIDRIKELEAEVKNCHHDIDSYREIDREHLKRIAELEQAEYVYAGQIAEYGVT